VCIEQTTQALPPLREKQSQRDDNRVIAAILTKATAELVRVVFIELRQQRSDSTLAPRAALVVRFARGEGLPDCVS
jgi:hypothetical protein